MVNSAGGGTCARLLGLACISSARAAVAWKQDRDAGPPTSLRTFKIRTGRLRWIVTIGCGIRVSSAQAASALVMVMSIRPCAATDRVDAVAQGESSR